MRWCMRPCWTHCSSISEQRALRFFTVSSKCCFSNASCSSSLLHTHTHTQLLYSHYQRTKHYTTNKLNSSSTFFFFNIWLFSKVYLRSPREWNSRDSSRVFVSVCAHLTRTYVSSNKWQRGSSVVSIVASQQSSRTWVLFSGVQKQARFMMPMLIQEIEVSKGKTTNK